MGVVCFVVYGSCIFIGVYTIRDTAFFIRIYNISMFWFFLLFYLFSFTLAYTRIYVCMWLVYWITLSPNGGLMAHVYERLSICFFFCVSLSFVIWRKTVMGMDTKHHSLTVRYAVCRLLVMLHMCIECSICTTYILSMPQLLSCTIWHYMLDYVQSMYECAHIWILW
jgi:hypothetical protein